MSVECLFSTPPCLAHERRGDEVNVVGNAPQQNVVPVFLRDGGQIHHHARQVHVLALNQKQGRSVYG
jgi:hypothetical protein